MTTATTAERAAAPTPNGVLPQFRAELSRLTHRRMLRVLAALLLVGIVAGTVIVFTQTSKSAGEGLERAQRQLAAQIDRESQNWDQCVAQTPDARECGPDPRGPDGPQLDWFYTDPRFGAELNLPIGFITVSFAGAAIAFLLGASVGGAEWSSRSMTLQLLWEPRRLRLYAIKLMSLLLAVMAITAVALLTILAASAVVVSLHGFWDGTDADFWQKMIGLGLRGTGLSALTATIGYSVAMLVRNTGASIGVAFVYFAVLENAVRLGFARFGPDQYLLSANAAAWLVPGGVEVPGPRVGTGDMSYANSVLLTNGRGLIALICYGVVLSAPALWSFRQRDVS